MIVILDYEMGNVGLVLLHLLRIVGRLLQLRQSLLPGHGAR